MAPRYASQMTQAENAADDARREAILAAQELEQEMELEFDDQRSEDPWLYGTEL